MDNGQGFDLQAKVEASKEDGRPKKLSVRMMKHLGYKTVADLHRDMKAMSQDEKLALVADFNRQGLPTVLE